MADKRFVDDVNSIVRPGVVSVSLQKPETPVAIPSKIGTGRPTDTASSNGISSPLTETAYEDRLWYDWVTLLSSDGIFSMKTRRIKEIKMLDAGMRSVVLDYKEPAA